ncbi:hypothetical protein F4803DRAFT_540656 [Xylaria telfairii]|nr:hypothetical protein F4803DRAFT_540656 [Xylaria telfairii]
MDLNHDVQFPTKSTTKETSCEWHRLSIIIFVGDPVDAPHYRRTGLLIQQLSPEATVIHQKYLQVIGTAGSFLRDESTDSDPTSSELLAGRVTVATIPVSGPSDNRLRDAIWSTAVNNDETDWNCQNWVGDALYSCTQAGLVSSDETEAAIDGMADLILQARDVV